MSEDNRNATNWGSVVVNLAIIALVAFALYLTRDLWVLLGLLLLPAVWARPEKAKACQCSCGKKDAANEKKCCGGGQNGCGGGHDCGC